MKIAGLIPTAAELKQAKKEWAKQNARLLHQIAYQAIEKLNISDLEQAAIFAYFERLLPKLNAYRTRKEVSTVLSSLGSALEHTEKEKPALAILQHRYIGKTKNQRLMILTLQSHKIINSF